MGTTADRLAARSSLAGDPCSLKTVQLGTSGTAAISSQSRTYDTLVTINAFSTSGGANQAGTVLETASTNGTGHTVRSRTDGAGRLIQAVDAENNISASEYDTQGNRTKYRDPTGVGEDCVYNELGWKTQCTDTQGDITKFAYNKAGDITKATDAKNKDTLFTYDARGRRTQQTDRKLFLTAWTYDANGNELSMTDGESRTTSYEYDDRNLQTAIQWPDHTGGVSGDATFGRQLTAYDAAGRPQLRTDQMGDTISLVYDLAGRLTNRQYRLKANSPAGAIADQDTFTYDAASRMLTAVKGRYANTVTFTYDTIGRKATESLTYLNKPVVDYRLIQPHARVVGFVARSPTTRPTG